MNNLFAFLKTGMVRFFGVSYREVNALAILLTVIGLLLLSPFFVEIFSADQGNMYINTNRFDSLATQISLVYDQSQHGNRFAFNPNLLSRDSLILLGFTPRVASNIVSYRQSGGQFKYKHDLFKIYGVDTSSFRQLSPYIQLPDFPSGKHSKNVRFDLNTANAEELQVVMGIGKVLSGRIIKYRDLLGGFVDHDQLYEVYGLQQELVDNIEQLTYISADFQPKTINIKTADCGDLTGHPYIGKRLAGTICDWVKEHPDEKTEQLWAFLGVDDPDIQKLFPYLTN